MLRQVGHYNDFSPEFLEKLEKKIEGFGKVVRYRFDIENENPDKTFYNGKTIFPQMYTLKPSVFNVIDKYENRTGKSKSKTAAIIKSTEMNEHGVLIPTFTKVRVMAGMKGILRLDLTNEEERDMCMLIELHGKLKNGEFADPTKNPVVSRIDEQADANTQRKERSDRLKAQVAAQEMSDEQIIQFSDAMQWDSSGQIEVLRNDVETLADTDPSFFIDLVSGKNLEYQAIAKKAMNQGIIQFDPAEYKFAWASNKQPIVMLSPIGEKNEIQKFSDWMMVGEKGAEVFKKLKSLTSGKKEPVV